MRKRPRATTAARASAAMIAAALLATASASARTSVFTCASNSRSTCDRGVLPATGRYNLLVNLGRPPGIRLVLVDRRLRFQHRIDDALGFFAIVFAGE